MPTAPPLQAGRPLGVQLGTARPRTLASGSQIIAVWIIVRHERSP
jgi:hypothetical protein